MEKGLLNLKGNSILVHKKNACTVELFLKKKKKISVLIIYGARSPQCGHAAPGPRGESVA